jgi:hypothetical protein
MIIADCGPATIILLVIYFIPSMVGEKKRNAGAIIALNLLLGWTVLGWIIALVWALTKDPPGTVVDGKITMPCPYCKTNLEWISLGQKQITCSKCGQTFPAP